MPGTDASKSSSNVKPAAENRAPFLRLRLSSVAAAVFLAFVAMGIAYIFGVMSGRDARQQPLALEAETIRNNDGGPAEGSGDGEDSRILAAEDLEFARILRNEKPMPQKDTGPAENPPAAGPPQRPEQDPESARAQPENKTVEDGGKIYDFVFQLAAFRDEGAADNLRQALEGYGLRTRLRRGGKMLVVLVLARGTPERAAEIGRIAERLRLGPPLELERKLAASP